MTVFQSQRRSRQKKLVKLYILFLDVYKRQSLNDTVKAIQIDGVDPTVENIKDGSYKISRPFNIATKDGLSEAAQDFIDFIMSADGQKVLEDNGYITVAEDAAAYAGSMDSGKVVIHGSRDVYKRQR